MRNLRIPGKNCSIFNCYSFRAAPGISFFGIPTKNGDKIKLGEQNCCSYYSCVVGNLKRQIKNRTLHTSRLFLLTKTFQYTSNWSIEKITNHIKHKQPNILSHDRLRGDDRTWRRVVTVGVIGGMGVEGEAVVA